MAVSRWLIFVITAALLSLSTFSWADVADRPKQTVWLMPPGSQNGDSLRELFTHGDQWKESRLHVDVVGYADHLLDSQFTDNELRAWFQQLQHWNLKLSLEAGALKEWGATAEKTFGVAQKKWDRFRSLGGNIYAIAMDEPLAASRNSLHKPTEYAVDETARFIGLVRQRYPDVLIGDIEPYPSFGKDELLAYLDSLQAKLRENGVRGLDFFRVDVDWMHFVSGNALSDGSWRDVKALEDACRRRKIPFGLIYWAADYPMMKRQNLADDATWYVGIMQQGYDYASVGGKPDQYVIESWVGAPSRATPENAEWTLTRSTLDFAQRFVLKPP